MLGTETIAVGDTVTITLRSDSDTEPHAVNGTIMELSGMQTAVINGDEVTTTAALSYHCLLRLALPLSDVPSSLVDTEALMDIALSDVQAIESTRLMQEPTRIIGAITSPYLAYGAVLTPMPSPDNDSVLPKPVCLSMGPGRHAAPSESSIGRCMITGAPVEDDERLPTGPQVRFIARECRQCRKKLSEFGAEVSKTDIYCPACRITAPPPAAAYRPSYDAPSGSWTATDTQAGLSALHGAVSRGAVVGEGVAVLGFPIKQLKCVACNEAIADMTFNVSNKLCRYVTDVSCGAGEVMNSRALAKRYAVTSMAVFAQVGTGVGFCTQCHLPMHLYCGATTLPRYAKTINGRCPACRLLAESGVGGIQAFKTRANAHVDVVELTSTPAGRRLAPTDRDAHAALVGEVQWISSFEVTKVPPSLDEPSSTERVVLRMKEVRIAEPAPAPHPPTNVRALAITRMPIEHVIGLRMLFRPEPQALASPAMARHEPGPDNRYDESDSDVPPPPRRAARSLGMSGVPVDRPAPAPVVGQTSDPWPTLRGDLRELLAGRGGSFSLPDDLKKPAMPASIDELAQNLRRLIRTKEDYDRIAETLGIARMDIDEKARIGVRVPEGLEGKRLTDDVGKGVEEEEEEGHTPDVPPGPGMTPAEVISMVNDPASAPALDDTGRDALTEEMLSAAGHNIPILEPSIIMHAMQSASRRRDAIKALIHRLELMRTQLTAEPIPAKEPLSKGEFPVSSSLTMLATWQRYATASLRHNTAVKKAAEDTIAHEAAIKALAATDEAIKELTARKAKLVATVKARGEVKRDAQIRQRVLLTRLEPINRELQALGVDTAVDLGLTPPDEMPDDRLPSADDAVALARLVTGGRRAGQELEIDGIERDVRRLVGQLRGVEGRLRELGGLFSKAVGGV